VIRGRRVCLRAFDRRHLEATRHWANDPELCRLLDRVWPISDDEHEHWFVAQPTQRNSVLFAIETSQGAEHVGNVWLSGIDWRHRKAEVRIVIGAPACTGRGLGTESLALICRYAFDRLNLCRVFAHVLAGNARARAAFERAGFGVEGVLRADRWVDGGYSDVVVLGRVREERAGRPGVSRGE
jgi:RimJ/RimL family protein N-acetyltransferase